jgi:hypothetical protein
MTTNAAFRVRRPRQNMMKPCPQVFRKPSTDQFDGRLFRLEQRLAELQRSNRRLRVMIGALVLVGGALITMAQASPNSSETVETRQFVLRDASGNVRAVLGSTPEGAVGLNIDDATGRTRLTLDVDYAGSPGLDLFDQNGKRRAIISLGQHGEPGVGLYDAEGKLRTSLDIPGANTPGLTFYHEGGKPAWGAP